jgi:D-lactate dehydrogenase (cytochrome)
MNAPLPSHMLPEIAQRETPSALIEALKSHFGDRCSTAMAVREQHVVHRAAAGRRGVCSEQR